MATRTLSAGIIPAKTIPPFSFVPSRLKSLHCLLLLVMLALTSCGQSTDETLPPRPVRAVQVSSVEGLSGLGFNATVSSRQETPLAFQVSGKVASRHVNSGDRVEAGQPLLTLESADFELQVQRLEAEIKVAEAERNTAKTDLDRFVRLQEQQFVSPTDLDQARNRFNASTGRLQATEAELALARRQLGYVTIKAAYSGWVNNLTAERGQVVEAGEPLGRLNSKQIEVLFELPEQHLAKLHPGDSLSASFWSCDLCDTEVTVREMGAAANETTGTLPVRATLASNNEQLRPGMSAWVEMPVNLPTGALVIPQIAVVQQSGEPAVWVVNSQSNNPSQEQLVRLRPVTLGAVVADKVLVTEGLAAGDWVVTAGQHLLADQHSVRILE